MPRRKSDARRMPYVAAEMPWRFSDRVVDVIVETSSSYHDAAIGGAFPKEIQVEVISSLNVRGEMPLDRPFDVLVQTSNSYHDAETGGAFPIEIQVEVISSFNEAFKPLSKEEEQTIKRHLSRSESSILVTHTNSSIAITGKMLSCLKPREWLNDEVINLYITLLKEREIREPEKHPKCHFFNTFFFTKLVKSGTEYNYEAVKKWTSMKKLGYHLKDCEKIFIPITMDLHWSLVVINIKDQKFQYLDSLKGNHTCDYIAAVARYFVDEVKDKSEVDIDVSRWKQEFVQDLPVQSNVFDCGMFILKYMDFYSRGMDLCFSQEDMPYFRLRTAKEILQLKAE